MAKEFKNPKDKELNVVDLTIRWIMTPGGPRFGVYSDVNLSDEIYIGWFYTMDEAFTAAKEYLTKQLEKGTA